MKRLFAPTVFASLTLIGLSFTAYAAPPNGGTSSYRSTSTAYSKPNTTISTTNYTPSTYSTSTKKVITTVGTTPSPNLITNNTYKPSSNGVKNITSTNTNIVPLKLVSKPPIPLAVKIPGKNSTTLVSSKLYASTYGVKFKRGIFFRGLNHNQWSAKHFHPRWRVWFWYCPCTLDWYYWNADQSIFLPVNVIVSYPPEVGVVAGTIPPTGEDVPKISNGGQTPDVPNPEGIE